MHGNTGISNDHTVDFHCPDLQPVHPVLADQEILVQAGMRDHREEKSIG